MTVLYQLASEQRFELADKTVGIVGVGNVGARLQRRLERLGVRLLLNDPPRAQQSPEGFVELDELLESADIISMHTPLVTEGPWPTRHLLDRERLERLRPGAILLNAGRGGAIDNQALRLVSQRRPDLTLVLDVWEGSRRSIQSWSGRYAWPRLTLPVTASMARSAVPLCSIRRFVITWICLCRRRWRPICRRRRCVVSR
ncbi:NAD(P)-dependent oxidoreductase [Marinobacterium aestuariivivens]|uniref:NAD(P)-dependent oxidoreductase n=1 Tax=Marinobacterium aestuariivivens TaxID=1698799 RepID=A0ABW1ZSZ1_9GAMM